MRAVNRFTATRGAVGVADKQPVAVFYRMRKDSQVFHSAGYGRVTARNSFTVSFADESRRGRETHGHIQLHAKINSQPLAIIRVLPQSSVHTLKPPVDEDDDVTAIMLSKNFKDQGIFVNQLASATRVTKSNHLVAVDVHSIRRKCVFLQVGNDSYVSHIPNFIECD